MVRLPIHARPLFIVMITLADDAGYGNADPVELRISIFPGDNEVTNEMVIGWLDQIEANGMAEFSEQTNGPITRRYYRLPSWEDHQTIRKDLTFDESMRKRYDAVTDPSQTRAGPVTAPSRKQASKEVSKEERKEARPDFDLVFKELKKKAGKEPKPALVQGILVECRELDANPLDFIEMWDLGKARSPLALIHKAKTESRDDWAERIGGWGKFEEMIDKEGQAG